MRLLRTKKNKLNLVGKKPGDFYNFPATCNLEDIVESFPEGKTFEVINCEDLLGNLGKVEWTKLIQDCFNLLEFGGELWIISNLIVKPQKAIVKMQQKYGFEQVQIEYVLGKPLLVCRK